MVNNEMLPLKCELCHQNKCIDAGTGKCTRCNNVYLQYQKQVKKDKVLKFIAKLFSITNYPLIAGAITMIIATAKYPYFFHTFYLILLWLVLAISALFIYIWIDNRVRNKSHVKIVARKERFFFEYCCRLIGLIVGGLSIYLSYTYIIRPIYNNDIYNISNKDISAIKITLQRKPNRGGEPSYTISINGKGQVMCELYNEVKLLYISDEQVKQIITLSKETDYFSLENSYDSSNCYGSWTHSSTVITSITINGKTKIVTDYLGQICTPSALRKLEDRIDTIEGLDKWVEANYQEAWFNYLKARQNQEKSIQNYGMEKK